MTGSFSTSSHASLFLLLVCCSNDLPGGAVPDAGPADVRSAEAGVLRDADLLSADANDGGARSDATADTGDAGEADVPVDGGGDVGQRDAGGCQPRLPGTTRIFVDFAQSGLRSCGDVCSERSLCCIDDYSWTETGMQGGALATYGSLNVALSCDDVVPATTDTPVGPAPLSGLACACR